MYKRKYAQAKNARADVIACVEIVRFILQAQLKPLPEISRNTKECTLREQIRARRRAGKASLRPRRQALNSLNLETNQGEAKKM